MITADIFYEDCITGMAERIADNSIHLTVTSIPFEELFTYSGKIEDVGNNGSTIDIREGRFALNMRFVVEQLLRVTAPGCNVCIHIQQLLAYKNQHGFIGRRDFNGAMRDVFMAGGFDFKGEFVIQKNPQAMAQRLNLHSLMFITGKRNSVDLAPCPNDYVFVFQKPGEIATPVAALFDKEKNPGGWITTDEWIRDAHGIWGGISPAALADVVRTTDLIDLPARIMEMASAWVDIQETDVLDGARGHKESDQEKHVCPLQKPVVSRLVQLYSNPASIQPDVKILDPFMGIGTTAHVAIELGRNVVGFELKESYHKAALANVQKAMSQRLRVDEQPSLFAEVAA